MIRDGRRPPTTRYGEVRLERRHEAAKPPTDPPPARPRDKRPPRGPEQPPRPTWPPRKPADPDKLPARPGFVIAVIVGLLLLARHRKPTGEPLGSRLAGPHHPKGWNPPRDEPAVPAWPDGKRPPLADNLPKGAKP